MAARRRIGSGDHWWRGYAAVWLCLVAAYFAFDDGVARLLIYNLSAPATAAAIVVGLRRHRPADPLTWWLLAAHLGMALPPQVASPEHDRGRFHVPMVATA